MALLSKYSNTVVAGAVVCERPVVDANGTVSYRTEAIYYFNQEQRKQALRSARESGARGVRDVGSS